MTDHHNSPPGPRNRAPKGPPTPHPPAAPTPRPLGGGPDPWARIGLGTPVSRVAVATVGASILAASLSIEAASEALVGAKDWVIAYFDWLFVSVATLAIGAVAILAFHPRANLRLGPDDARPEFGNLSWFAMLFSAGLASGLLYWGTAEPILHMQGNPFLDAAGADPAAPVATAMRITILHWGLHGWAFYVLAGLGIAVYGHRYGQALSFRSAFYPWLGPKYIDRWPGRAIDLVAVFGTVCGVATSIGISAAAINATLGALTGISVSVGNQILIVFGVCGLGILSAVSGIARGVRRLSELNVWVSAAMLLILIAFGPSLFIGGLFLDSLVDYARQVIPTGAWLGETSEQTGWQASWTVFYWGWWLAWTPFVGLFIARISRGRTVREFSIAVMLVPTLVTVLWMSVLGGTALFQEAAVPGSVSAAVAEDYSLGIVAVFGNLEVPAVGRLLLTIATFLLLTWLITSLDSATLVMCHLVGEADVAPAKIFWGLALAGTTTILLLVGGLTALQAASIVIGLPLAALLLLLGCGVLWHMVLRRRPGPKTA